MKIPLRFRTLTAATLFALSAGVAGLATGCEEGPAEEAGDNIDDAVNDTGDAVDDAFD